MGYSVGIDGYYRIKHKEKAYPLKGGGVLSPLTLFNDDVLSKNEDGTYTKHTGLCFFGIEIPDEDVEYVKKEGTLHINR